MDKASQHYWLAQNQENNWEASYFTAYGYNGEITGFQIDLLAIL